MADTGPSSKPEEYRIDDYHVDRHVGELTRPISHHAVSLVNAVLLIILAVVSFGLFWVVATLIGIV